MEIDRLKQELVEEIKALAGELAKSNTFVGLLSNEIKFRALQEKFINLKFLEHKNIGLEIFDQPVPTADKTLENDWEANEKEQSADENEWNVIEKAPQDAKHYTRGHEQQQDDLTAETSNDSDDWMSDETAGNESVKQEEVFEFRPVDDYADLVPERKFYPKIQLDFNDRIAFLNQLFEGDAESMELVINTLNHMDSISDSKAYLRDLKNEMNWDRQDEYIDRLEELIDKRFE